jgi:hypothetical protein
MEIVWAMDGRTQLKWLDLLSVSLDPEHPVVVAIQRSLALLSAKRFFF